MRIMAGSEMGVWTGFLHAGYISAYPRAYESGNALSHSSTLVAWPASSAASAIEPKELGQTVVTDGIQTKDSTESLYSTDVVIDITYALRLERESLAVPPKAVPNGAAAVHASQGTVLFGVVILFFMLLAAFYKMRRGVFSFFVFVIILIGVVFWGTIYWSPAPSSVAGPAPWDSIAVRTYADPELATRVLLHGIIADALMSTPKYIASLPELASEVGLPIKQLTEGQAYALKTYGVDGWGHAFQFRSECKDAGFFRKRNVPNIYHISSAGQDGVFGTIDDLRLKLNMPDEYTWDQVKPALFAHKNGDDIQYFYRRWSGSLFSPSDPESAREFTGTDLYDVMPHKIITMPGNRHDPFIDVERTCRKQWNGLPYDPVFLIILYHDWPA
ncbi:MAG TPA: hypothetical protein PLI09_16340 [Candidatus Hydrogenedentes bacterium]|mgnify:CR=1 FL=1|nr:hypothetical protein [Candidatus Hydrogenedentota bacterium]